MTKGCSLVLFLLLSNGFAQRAGYGEGNVVGKPTGFSCKYWLDRTNSLDGAVA